MKYLVLILAASVGLYIFGLFGAVVAILLWWCINEIQTMNQK